MATTPAVDESSYSLNLSYRKYDSKDKTEYTTHYAITQSISYPIWCDDEKHKTSHCTNETSEYENLNNPLKSETDYCPAAHLKYGILEKLSLELQYKDNVPMGLPILIDKFHLVKVLLALIRILSKH